MGSCRRSAASIRASPAWGPAPVTMVPVARTPASRTADSAVSQASGRGTTRLGGAVSSSPIRTYSTAATQARSMDGRRCSATVHHTSPASTVMPPMTACATMPSGMARASIFNSVRRPARKTARIRAAATATRTKVRSRLPNSMAWWMAGPAPGTGTKLSWLQRGQVSHPSPEAVTRTVTPVVMMPIWAITLARAMPFWTRRDGIGSRESGPPDPFDAGAAGAPEVGACDVEVTAPILGRAAPASAIR